MTVADEREMRGRGPGVTVAERVRAFTGTYGDYLTAKVARVFPRLFDEVT